MTDDTPPITSAAEPLVSDERASLLARIAELERAYKGLLEMNERNCDDALRIKRASEATRALMFLTFDDIKAKQARIDELEAENRELSRMVSP